MIHSVHLVSNLDRSFGGPAISVPELGVELERLGIEVTLMSVTLKGDVKNEVIERAGLHHVCIRGLGRGPLYIAPEFQRKLAQLVRPDSVIHLHSMWPSVAYYALQVIRKTNVPLVLAPRSNLYDQSLARHRFRKWLLQALYINQLFGRVSCWHATEPDEVSAIEKVDTKHPIALVPNGIRVDEARCEVSRAEAKLALNWCMNSRVLLFLSRIHPRKGLIELVRSFMRHEGYRHNWVLSIVGPIQDREYFNQVSIAASDHWGKGVRYEGEVYGKNKWLVYRAAELFALPSKFENFGISIGEALASGIPVLTTKSCPWPQIKEHDAGWWIEDTPAALDVAMGQILFATEEELAKKGERSVGLVQSMSWRDRARDMSDIYRWLLNRSPEIPRCLVRPS